MTDQEHDEPVEQADGTETETTAITETPELTEAPTAATVDASAEADDEDDPIEAAFDDDDFDGGGDAAGSDPDPSDPDPSDPVPSDPVSSDSAAQDAGAQSEGPAAEPSAEAQDGDEDAADAAPPVPEDPPEIPLDQIDTDALWVVRRLRAKGHEAYLTGGCVRDLLLGKEPKDFDVATAAHPDEVKKVFRNCRLIGRRFRLAHITFPGGKVIETATFRANPNDDADEEELEGDLLVERDNVFGTVEEDARRRDLTINGLFYDPIDGKVLDYVDGRADLDARLIRTIGDPQIRFQEDPVRILRAIKFATRLGFDFEEATADAMKNHVEELVRCAPARLQDEIQKLLLSGYAREAFALCEKFGVIEALMPELVAALGDAELQTRELSDEEKDAFRDRVRSERRKAAAAAKAAVEAEAAAAAEANGEAAPEAADAEAAGPEGDAAEAAPASDDVPATEAEAEPAAPDAPADEPPAEQVSADEASEDAVAPVTAEAPEAAEPVVEEEPIEVPTHGAAPKTPAERRQRLDDLLAGLDQARERGVQIASSVALGALLLPAWEAMRAATHDEDAWLDALGAAWTERLRMTRRDRETIQRLMMATEEMRPARRFGQSARSLVGRPWFREALLLYTLVVASEKGDLSEVAAWKAIANHYERPYRQPRIGERDAKPRRSRRRSAPRGRGRRRGGGGGR